MALRSSRSIIPQAGICAGKNLLRTFTVEDGHEATPGARATEFLECRRHARSADAYHDGQELMREGEFAFDAIRRHQQPAGQAFLWLGSLASAACEV